MDVFDEILTALQTEDRVMLATIISTTGSTPAAALSKMLVKQGGIVSLGTVGGGCMEGDVLLHATRLFNTGKAEVLTFHLNEDDIEHGLICGGSLDVLIEPIAREQIPLLKEIQSVRDEGEDGVLVRFINNSGVVEFVQLIRWRNGIMEGWSKAEQLSQYSIERAYHRNETVRLKVEQGEFILEPITGTPILIIFGGGHVSRYISRAASMVGFRVTIVDDREKYANAKRFPEAVQTLAIDFMEAFNQLKIKSSTYIVIVTRGHRFDEDILELALKTSAKYLGMIGSKRKVFTTFEHLVEKGISIEGLRRVHAPTGIEIGAVTAEEIAVSIVAQLIRVRRGETVALYDKSDELKELLHSLEKKHSLA